MNKAAVDNYRELLQSRLEELTLMNAQQNSDIHYVKDTVDEIKILLKEQNGRVRSNEKMLSAISAIGGVLALVFSGAVAWLSRRL
jgi:hypothetical protein